MAKARLRMRELESLTGIGRETIRFYLREGLLPEPERPKRNVALYSDEHVRRLTLIKRLQEERFLPLAMIKAVLDGSPDERVRDIAAFPHLDQLLADRLDADAALTPLAELERELREPAGARDALADAGLIRPETGPDGQPALTATDTAIVRAMARLRVAGFTEERGFTPDRARFYAVFVDWLVGQEIRLFYDLLAGRIGEQDAAHMAQEGLAEINQILGLMRRRAIQHRLTALTALSRPRPADEESLDEH